MSGALRPLATLALWLALLGAGAAVIWRSSFSTDMSAFLPAAPDARQQVLIEQLQSGTPARTLLLAIEGGDPTQRASASRALAQALRDSPLFEQVLNGDTRALASLGAWVLEHRYVLSPAVLPQRFSAEGLREAIGDTLSLLGTPAGVALKPLLERDPTGETQRIAEAGLGGQGPRSEQGLWVSGDGQRALLMTRSRAAGADLDAQQAAIARIRQSFDTVAVPGLTLRISGTPRFAVDSRARIEREVRLLAIAGTLLMGALLWLSFGSFAALAAAMLPVASGVIAGVVAVSLGFGSVHGITLAFGTTLIGEAVDYAIYYLIQARGVGWRLWLRQGWPTIRLGLLTSICGFVALAFSGFPGLAQLGVFSIAGLVASALTTRFVLPVLLPDGARGGGLRRGLGRWAGTAIRVLPRTRHAWSALGLVAAALLALQHDKLWSAELSSLSTVPQAELALDASLRAELAPGDSGLLIVVQAADEQSVLQATERVAARLQPLVDAGRLGGFNAATRLLPSLATQQQRRAALPDGASLSAALEQATTGGPLPASRLASFVNDVQLARAQAPLTAATIRGSAAAPLVDTLLIRRPNGQWASLLLLQPGAEAPNEAMLQAALQGVPGAQALDMGGELRRLYRHYLHEAQAQALLGGLGVLALMALWLRSWPRLLAVSQPLLLAVLLTLGGFTLLQVPLGILHLVGLLLVVAVGSNYALFFDLLQHKGGADEDTLASLLLANLTTVLSFGLIALSDIPALSAIGRVVAPGALLALLLSAAYVARPPTRQPVPPSPMGAV